MKLLFDNGTPKPIASRPTGRQVAYGRQIGRHELANGELIETGSSRLRASLDDKNQQNCGAAPALRGSRFLKTEPLFDSRPSPTTPGRVTRNPSGRRYARQAG